MAKINKQYITKQVNVDDDSRTITATITTSAVDRVGEVVMPKGGNFDNYMKAPTVLYAHDYDSKPWAKAIYIDRKQKEIVAKMKVAETQEANEIYELYKGGFLNTFSIGFNPTKGHTPTPKEIEKKPYLAEARYIFDEWELLEFSAVPVPCNPEALVNAVKSKSLNLSDSTLKLLDIEIEEDREIHVTKEVDALEVLNPDCLYAEINDRECYCKFCLVESAINENGKQIDVLYGIDGKHLEPVVYLFTDWQEKDVKTYCKAAELKYNKETLAIEPEAVSIVEVIKASEIEIEPDIQIMPDIYIKDVPEINIKDEAIKKITGKIY